MTIRILVVADDQRLLKQLQQLLHPMQTQWDITFLRSSREAIPKLMRPGFDIVIADLRLEDMDGAEFLAQVANRFPQTIRFVLAEEATGASLIRTITSAHQYIAMNSTLDAITTRIERALRLRNSLSGDNLKKLVAKIHFLPSLPDLYLRIMQEMRSPSSSLAVIGELIGKDVGMSTKVLKLVNSAYFGLPQRVTSPAHAASMLGLDIIKSMILMLDVLTQFDRIRSSVPAFSLDSMQSHSFAVSGLAKAIATKEGLGQAAADEAYLAGLFHDVGKLVLIANMPQEYSQVLATSKARKVPIWLAEWSTFGATHAEVGAYLLGLWGFNDAVVEACAFHHQPSFSPPVMSTIATIHIANVIEHTARPVASNISWSKLDEEFLQKSALLARIPVWQALYEHGA